MAAHPAERNELSRRAPNHMTTDQDQHSAGALSAEVACSALSMDEARRKMYAMSFRERIAFVRAHGWTTKDSYNWWRPGWGWNYDTESAVVCILMYPPNGQSAGSAAQTSTNSQDAKS